MRKSLRPVALILIPAIIAIFVVSAFLTPQPTGPHMDWSYSATATSPSVEHWSDGKFRVQKTDGSYRMATDKEVKMAAEGAFH